MISSCSSAVVSAPTKKSSARIVRAPVRAGDGDLGVAGDADAGHLGGGIGMRDAAADGAAVADLVVRDMLDRGLEQRMRGGEPRVVLDVAPAHHGAEPHAVGGDLDLAQLRRACAGRPAAPARPPGRPASASGSARRQWPARPRHGRRAARRLRTSVAGQAYSSGGSFMAGSVWLELRCESGLQVHYIRPSRSTSEAATRTRPERRRRRW